MSSRSYSMHAIHMIRTAQTNTLTLSQMADQKASILMGATFLVFSLSVSRSFTGSMPLALIVLAFFSFLSSLCAVMAVIPSVGKQKSGPGHTPSAPNKLFFGHFTLMDEEEWKQSVLDELQHDETVFLTMMHDIYQNGQVLHRRKYRFLGMAYRIFISGLFITLLMFGFEFIRAY